MKRLLIGCLPLWLVVAALGATDELRPMYSATRIEKAPVIDGRLTEACWQGLEPTAPFTCIGGAPAPTAIRGMVCWDEKNLYIVFVCPDPRMAELRQRMAAGILPPYAESVEIWLDPNHDRFNCLQLRVDILGNRDSRPDGDTLDRSVNSLWSAAVAIDNDRWTVEAAIPLSLISKTPPGKGTIWGLNLNLSSERGCFCWSDTQGPFHAPGRFGNLVFHPYPVFLRSHFAAAFRAARAEMERLGLRELTRNLIAVQEENERFLKSLETTPVTSGQQAAGAYLDGQRRLTAWEDEMSLRVIKTLAEHGASSSPPHAPHDSP